MISKHNGVESFDDTSKLFMSHHFNMCVISR